MYKFLHNDMTFTHSECEKYYTTDAKSQLISLGVGDKNANNSQ